MRPADVPSADARSAGVRPAGVRPARTRPARLTWAQVRAQWPLALVLIGMAVALGFIVLERWRRGAFLLGVVALAAAALRLVVPEERARLLGVRSKRFDVVTYIGIGTVILWLATSVDSLGTG